MTNHYAIAPGQTDFVYRDQWEICQTLWEAYYVCNVFIICCTHRNIWCSVGLLYANSSSADSLILYFKILGKRAWNMTQCQALAQHLQGPGFNSHTKKKIDGKTASVWHIYRELFLLISQTAQLFMQHYIITHTMKILEMFENSMGR